MNDNLEAILDDRRGQSLHYDPVNLDDVTFDDLYIALKKNYRLEQISVIHDLINQKLKEQKVDETTSSNRELKRSRSFKGVYFAMDFRDYFYAFASGDPKRKKESLEGIRSYLEPLFTGDLKLAIPAEDQSQMTSPCLGSESPYIKAEPIPKPKSFFHRLISPG